MITALVPAKALGEAKGRLAALMPELERRELMLAMLEDVLSALTVSPEIGHVVVVSPDDEVLNLATRLGATPIAESASVRGVNQALSRATSVMPRDTEALLVVLGDVPELTPDNVAEVVAALPERGIAIVPSHDRGTSILAMRPPGVIPFRFGPQSSVLHKREAAARKLDANVVHLASLWHDIDDPDDLRDFLSRPGETATHRVLARFGVAERLGVA